MERIGANVSMTVKKLSYVARELTLKDISAYVKVDKQLCTQALLELRYPLLVVDVNPLCFNAGQLVMVWMWSKCSDGQLVVEEVVVMLLSG